jgi:hypothetical protein
MKNASGAVRANRPATSWSDWERTLKDRVPVYGHRNWFVVADSAYPAQSQSGIETIVASADHLLVVETVLAVLRASGHVKPITYTDQELAFVDERDAPGVSSYRDRLANLLKDLSVSALPHEEIISKLDRAGQIFRVMIIKTDMKIAYTSVFFELDCAYWNAGAESRLRSTLLRGFERGRKNGRVRKLK